MTAAIEDHWRRRRKARILTASGYGLMMLIGLAVSANISEASPAALWSGAPRIGIYLGKLVPDFRWHSLLAGPQTEGSIAFWMYRLPSWAWLLFETSQMALLATLGGTLAGTILCFPAAANLAPNRLVYLACRRLLELFRAVPDIVYALILVWTFGVGPLAGILAIALHTAGATGKLFADVVESADMRPWESVRAAGGTWLHGIRFAILPQVAPNFLSYLLMRFEINVRGATVIGFVGAGGIGQELYTVISFNYYQEISAILVLIVLAVSTIDLTSEWLRGLASGDHPSPSQ